MSSQMNLIEGLYITIVSMGLVCLTLALISLILSSFKYIFKEKESKELKACKEVALTDEIFEEDKVVVALAASIMAGQGKVNPNLRVKSIKRIR